MSATTDPVFLVTAMDAGVKIKALAGLLRRPDLVIGTWALGYFGHQLVVIGLPGDAEGNAQLCGEAALDALAEARLEAGSGDTVGSRDGVIRGGRRGRGRCRRGCRMPPG